MRKYRISGSMTCLLPACWLGLAGTESNIIALVVAGIALAVVGLGLSLHAVIFPSEV